MSLKGIPLIHQGEPIFFVGGNRKEYIFASYIPYMGKKILNERIQVTKIEKKNVFLKNRELKTPPSKNMKVLLYTPRDKEFKRIMRLFPGDYIEEMEDRD